MRGKRPSLPKDAHVFGILGRILGPMTAYQYKPPPEIKKLHEELRDRILPIFEREGAAKVSLKTRIAAADALGRGGDPRLAGDNFIEVPDTDGVSLGKYLVTVTEYQAFVDAGGYHERKYWDDEGWWLRENEGWGEPDDWDRQLEHTNWPVTRVSWHEAGAYCRWRSGDNQWMIRLPSEAEWQAAATPDGREYPWGSEEPDPERANFGRNVEKSTPVGVYPPGDGPYGHCDLAGNVWEWLEDCWNDSFKGVPEGGGAWRSGDCNRRVLRGGSWTADPSDMRSAYRFCFGSSARFNSLGFRVARTVTS